MIIKTFAFALAFCFFSFGTIIVLGLAVVFMGCRKSLSEVQPEIFEWRLGI